MTGENMNLSDLVDIPSGDLSDEDYEKYNGTKVEIAEVIPMKKQVPFAEEFGKMLPDGQTREVAVAIVVTKPIGTNALGQPITVKEEFALKKHPITGKYGPNKHEKSKTFKFFNLLKVNSFQECVGKQIVVVKRVTQKGRKYLGFSI